jgi:YD repeat-containing protein
MRKGGNVKVKMKLFIALLCVLIACIAWSPSVLATSAVGQIAAGPAVAAEISPLGSNKTAEQIANDPVVKAAIDAAWADSNADNTTTRHEEGGWIYEDADGNLSVQRWPAGNRSSIDPCPAMPPPGGQVVGEFHTHPNWHPPDGKDEAGKEWKQGPSEADKNAKTPGTVGIVKDRSSTWLY